MSGVLDGVRVLEVAHYAFAPAAGAVLAEWGADVIKVEDTAAGDPVRATVATRYEATAGGFSYMWEIVNRNKRGIALDLTSDDGRAAIDELAGSADVFLTSMVGPTRRKLGIDEERIRRRNPRVVYASASAYGGEGPQADAGGYDLNAYWCRSGIAAALMSDDAATPAHLPVPAFGDLQAGLALAGGIAAALVRRQRTGAGATVDVSLLGTGMWAMQGSILASHLSGRSLVPLFSHRAPVNPLGNVYATADGRHLVLAMRRSQPWWRELCERLGHPDVADDPRFADADARQRHTSDCAAELAGIFASRPLAHWVAQLEGFPAAWDVVRHPGELRDDPQVVANGYLAYLDGAGAPFPVVRTPVTIDGGRPRLGRAPAHGQHAAEVAADGGWPARPVSRLPAVVLNVRDLAASLGLYVDALGLVEVARGQLDGATEVRLAPRGGGVGPCLGLVARPAPPDVEWPAAWGHVVVPVADVVASAEAVRAAGHWVGEVRRDDDGDVPALAVRLYDPDGYVVELVGPAVMP